MRAIVGAGAAHLTLASFPPVIILVSFKMTEPPPITQNELRPNKNGIISSTPIQPIPPSTLNLSKETHRHQNPSKEAVSNHSNESHPSPSCTLFLATKYALIGAISIGICLYAVAFFRAEETAEMMLASPLYRRYNTKDRKYHVSLLYIFLY